VEAWWKYPCIVLPWEGHLLGLLPWLHPQLFHFQIPIAHCGTLKHFLHAWVLYRIWKCRISPTTIKWYQG
jgi:hypothetical protein